MSFFSSSLLKRSIGIAIAVVLFGFVGAVALSVWWTGPQLTITVESPEQVYVDRAFTVAVRVFNPHPDPVELDNIEMPLRALEFLEVLSTRPEANPLSPFDILGLRIWQFEIVVPPAESRTVELTMSGTVAANTSIELGVCNNYEDCTLFKKQLNIVHEFVESPNEDVGRL